MKRNILLAFGLCFVLVTVASASSSRSSDREKRSILQHLAIDRMLRDRGFVMPVINCVLDKAPCDKHGSHLKRLVPEVLRGHCPGCDRNVQTQVRRVITHVQRNFPQLWSEVVARFLHSVQHPSQSLQNVFG